MILSAAQFAPEDGNVEKNLGFHYNLVDIAYTHHVQLIVFPELSITGYMREHARDHSFTLNDTRLSGLRKLARDYSMTIIAGAPIKISDQLFIGSFILNPNNSIDVYIKHNLHEGEETVFQASPDFNPTVIVDNEKFAAAICYDIEIDYHIKMACDIKAAYYVPSIFYSKAGIQKGHDRLKQVAANYNLNVLMSNFCGGSYGIKSGGRSAFWNNKGELVEQMDEDSQGLIVVEKTNETWKGTSIFTNYE